MFMFHLRTQEQATVSFRPARKMNLWNTPPTPTQAKAFLGIGTKSAIFNFNPDEVKWAYKNNTVSRDTIGGRVVQVLSSSVEAMTVTGRAGSRERLQIFAKDLKDLMQYHIKTSEPVNFKVPSRNWDFRVYIQNISSLGWDATSTSYPYELTLTIQEDLNNIIDFKIKQDVFENLVQGMGYNPLYHGGNLTEATRYIEAMSNALGFVNLGSSSSSDNGGLGTGKYKPRSTGDGGNQGMANALLAKAGNAIDSVPKVSTERFITVREIYALAYWALDALGNLTGSNLQDVAIKATAVSCCETQRHDTQAQAEAVRGKIAYGLWQMNEGLGTSLWDPIIAALRMAEEYYQQQWLYWSCGRDSNVNGYKKYIDQVRSEVS